MSHKRLEAAISAVQHGPSVTARTEAADHLAEITHGIRPETVDEAILTRMVGLLDSSEESVRAGVAAALGNLGPRAKMAVPKLLAILPQNCLVLGLSSEGAIRLALRRIGAAAPPPVKC